MNSPDTLEAQMNTRLQDAYRDMASKNLEKLMALYAPDALIQSSGSAPITGTAAIRQFWRETFEAFDLCLVPVVDEVRADHELIFVRGHADGTMLPRDGSAPSQVHVWFHQVYIRSPDGTLLFWRGGNGAAAP